MSSNIMDNNCINIRISPSIGHYHACLYSVNFHIFTKLFIPETRLQLNFMFRVTHMIRKDELTYHVSVDPIEY